MAYLQAYTDEMTTAREVLDYLTKIYNAVSRFIDSQQVFWTTYHTTTLSGLPDVLKDVSNPYYGTKINEVRSLLPYPRIGFSNFRNSASSLTCLS